MEEKTITELYSLTNSNSEEALLELLRRFKPLLNKYAYKLGDYEDAYSELQLHLIQLIKNIPSDAASWNAGQLVSYIAKSINTYYIKLSKQHCFRENNILEFNPDIMDSLTNENTTVFLKDYLQELTRPQREIIFLHYIQGLSIQEIVSLRNISRQAANKIKNQALKQLQKQFDIQKENTLLSDRK